MKVQRPVILVFNKFYLPGYLAGGPIRTLANMVERLGGEFDFRIVTLDREAGSDESYAGIAPDAWNIVGKAQVMYWEPSTVSLQRVIDIVSVTSPSVVYLNSFFDATFTQRVLWARRLRRLGRVPVVLAPRGEFSDGALRLKRTKKCAYLYIAKLAGLYRNLIWQASTGLERLDILRNFRFVNQAEIQEALDVAPVVDGLTITSSVRGPGTPLRVCFLARITPMKNLDFALRVLANVKARVVFTIYGPKGVPAYWAECEKLIVELPSNVSVIYGDELHPSAVKNSLAQHDVFLFPTRGENYGHVIHEALSAGLPVLLSDQTPWGEVFKRGIGWVLSLDSETAFARVLDEVASWEDEQMRKVRIKAVEYAIERAVNPEVLKANRELFLRAMSRVSS